MDIARPSTAWFTDARFGLFLHWGLYAIPARGEWVRSAERMSIEDYQRYFEAFDPVDYDPRAWAKAAKRAGMRYAVMTAKHHDGFCLFDSRLTAYKATNTPAGRDLVREYVDAFRAEGLKVGLYYSLLDWHHPDYPAYGDRQHPMRDQEAWKGRKQDFAAYIAYFHGQVRELLTGYGTIDVLWFDFSYGDLFGEAWGASDLVRMVRYLQPDVLIDDRLGGNLRARAPEIYAGDFASPEQIIPAGGVRNDEGVPLPWESCLTLNNSWGYCASDRDCKTAETVIHALVECVSKNGNLLLNVGPDARGRIPDDSLSVLSEIGDWMDRNRESIHGCGAADLPKPDWGRYTRKGTTIYAHVLERGVGPVWLEGVPGSRVDWIRYLADRSEVRVGLPDWMPKRDPEQVFVNFPSSRLPDERDTVLEIRMKPATTP